MNKITAKFLSLLIAVMLFAGVLAGCGGAAGPAETTAPAGTTGADGETAAAAPTESTIDVSKAVELQFYAIGDAPGDLQPVTDKVNELIRDLNCTVKFNYTTWTDYQTKYSLILSSGQPVDLIYTAVWLHFPDLVKAGAFLPLDDLLPKYAPELQKALPEDLWKGMSYDGKIYGIPSLHREYMNNGVVYRKDLAEKFGLPEPKDLDTLEQYLLGVKKNMPQQQLLQDFVVPGIQNFSFTVSEVLYMKYQLGFGPRYGLQSFYDNPKELAAYWGGPDFITDMKLFKKWADEGLWSRSALSNKTDTEAFVNGKTICMVNGVNIAKFTDYTSRSAVAHPDWKIGYIGFPDVNGGKYWPNHAAQNATSIPTTARNPERALMFYQKLVLDKTLNQLTNHGFEGTHYTVDADGYYVPIGDPTKTGFRKGGMNGWAWRNPEFMLWNKTDQILLDTFAKCAENAGPNQGDGFIEDFSTYQAERAALGTVMTQYLAPLQAGLVPDVDAAVKTFMDKANAAGLQKIQDAVRAQWAQYAAEQGW